MCPHCAFNGSGSFIGFKPKQMSAKSGGLAQSERSSAIQV
jgi:hypothetical protein